MLTALEVLDLQLHDHARLSSKVASTRIRWARLEAGQLGRRHASRIHLRRRGAIETPVRTVHYAERLLVADALAAVFSD